MCRVMAFWSGSASSESTTSVEQRERDGGGLAHARPRRRVTRLMIARAGEREERGTSAIDFEDVVALHVPELVRDHDPNLARR